MAQSDLPAATLGEAMDYIELHRLQSLVSEALEAVVASRSPEGRLYVIDVVAFGEGGWQAQRTYEEAIVPARGRYGYKLEHKLYVSASREFSFDPQLVTIGYFNSLEEMTRLDKDPESKQVDTWLTSDADRQLVMLAGRLVESKGTP